MENVIVPELLYDNLSDVPEDIFSDSENDSDDSERGRKIVCPKQSYTESKKKKTPRKVTIITILQMWGQPHG
jgi:hypothetical protein